MSIYSRVPAKAVLCTIAFLSISFPCFAQCSKEAAVAVRFLNQYVAYDKAATGKRTTEPESDWVKRNRLVSPGFPKAYEDKIREGRESDPELGWDANVIFDAQDWPENGFRLFKCSNTSGFVMLQGTGVWSEFKLTVKVIPTQAGLKVDGVGMVNIPESERAPRK
jgi:hypothetical protein